MVELEASCPWELSEFRAGLSALTGSAQLVARQWAADVRVLAGLVAMVPRCAGDERGASPWTSLRREVAVARSVTDQAAAGLIRAAVALTSSLPVMLGLLETGGVTVEPAGAFVRELEPYDDELAGRVDAELAVRAAALPAWRVAQEVRRAVQVLAPELAAQRVAVKNASRGVSLQADADDQAAVTVFGPAVPLVRWHSSLDEQARALKAAGDLRGLEALRFDLATSTFPCALHPPADPTGADADTRAEAAPADGAPADGAPGDGAPAGAAAAGLRPSFVEAAPTDCRRSRPVQAQIVVPVETALGLSNEPGWLEGYGWLSAPSSRLLLVDAELRKVCAHATTGQLLDVAEQLVRPVASPVGVRAGLLELVVEPATLGGIADRVEPEHDPSERLRQFVLLRDRGDDGPTGTRMRAAGYHLDHDEPYPQGATAAWNLAVRAERTHQLKHYGWVPVRTASMTVWASPAGQLIQVPNWTAPPPGIDRDGRQDRDGREGRDDHGRGACLRDPDELDLIDRAQLEPPADDGPPWLPASERAHHLDLAHRRRRRLLTQAALGQGGRIRPRS